MGVVMGVVIGVVVFTPGSPYLPLSIGQVTELLGDAKAAGMLKAMVSKPFGSPDPRLPRYSITEPPH